MPASGAVMARHMDAMVRRGGEAVTCYTESNPPALLGTTHGMFQFNEAAQDLAMEAGVDPGLVAQLFVLSTAGALLRHRGRVQDAEGQWWLVDSKPVSQRLGGIVIGVNAFVRRQLDAPVGS